MAQGSQIGLVVKVFKVDVGLVKTEENFVLAHMIRRFGLRF